jgi:hypothetical protein
LCIKSGGKDSFCPAVTALQPSEINRLLHTAPESLKYCIFIVTGVGGFCYFVSEEVRLMSSLSLVIIFGVKLYVINIIAVL